MCGGVVVNYHTLNDFRAGYEKPLNALFTKVLACLVHKGVVTVDRISQDGAPVRASAGSSSFRGRKALERLEEQMRGHVEALPRQLDDPAYSGWAGKRAGQQRAAGRRLERVEQALEELCKVEEVKILAPVPKPRTAVSPYEPREGDGPGVAAWRRRMGTEEAKAKYKQRASMVETVNGDLKSWRELRPFLVRGLKKVRCIALWSALAYNVMHFAEVLVGLTTKSRPELARIGRRAESTVAV